MTRHQLDLFSGAGPSTGPSSPGSARQPTAAAELDDAALIAAIGEAGLADVSGLAAETGRRRLAAAVPALVALCRRFAGFEGGRVVPEQKAALGALAEIGDPEAAQVVAPTVARAVAQGPTLLVALDAAARLHARLPGNLLAPLLRHGDAAVCSAACRCARRPAPEIHALLTTLLGDGDRTVAESAACALGRLGRVEARAALKRMLREAPSSYVIDAVSAIADEECMILLGRLARTRADLADTAVDALESIDHPRASEIASGLPRRLP